MLPALSSCQLCLEHAVANEAYFWRWVLWAEVLGGDCVGFREGVKRCVPYTRIVEFVTGPEVGMY